MRCVSTFISCATSDNLPTLAQNLPNRYEFQKAASGYLLAVPSGRVVDLANHNGQDELRVADPRYLRLHVACAKIAHASGAADVINDFVQGYENLKTLSADGSSHELLSQALSSVMASDTVR